MPSLSIGIAMRCSGSFLKDSPQNETGGLPGGRRWPKRRDGGKQGLFCHGRQTQWAGGKRCKIVVARGYFLANIRAPFPDSGFGAQ